MKPEWICFNYENITRIFKFKGGPGIVPPSYCDYDVNILHPPVKFVYSHTVMSAKFTRHVYKVLQGTVK